MNPVEKVVMECVIETKASTIVQFLDIPATFKRTSPVGPFT